MPRFIVVFALLLAMPVAGWAQESIDSRCFQPSQTSCVDWEHGVAIAIGLGAPAAFANNPALKNLTARRAARLDAARNLLELVKGVNLNSESTMQNAMVQDDTVRTTVEGKLHGIREVGAPKYFSDGSIQVKLEARLYEIIPTELYAPQEGAGPRLLPPPGGPLGGGAGLNPQSVYSGLIIDARGTGVAPAMSPKVFDPEGREVYGSAYVSREFAISQGMVGYLKSVDAARESDRVKGSPAVIKAVEAKGPNNADLVISKEDADALRAISQNQTFLREARVMIVLD